MRFNEELERRYIPRAVCLLCHVIWLQPAIDGRGESDTQSARSCHSPFEGFSAQRLLKSNRVEVQLCRKKEQRNESSKGRPSSLIHPMNDLQSSARLRKERRTQESDAERRTKESTRRFGKSHCASHPSARRPSAHPSCVFTDFPHTSPQRIRIRSSSTAAVSCSLAL